jgi:DNA-binding CsgD family transcriptional regulator
MSALARGDERRLLSFIAEADTFGGEHPFEGEFLAQLGKLVPADWIGYDEWITSCGEAASNHFVRPGDEQIYSDVDWEAVDPLFETEDPVLREFRLGRFGALKFSDFLGRRDLQRNPLYNLLLAPLGLRDSLAVRLPIGPATWTKRFCFDRGGGDFGTRDRAVLEILSPHLVRLYRAGVNQRRLHEALAVYEAAEAAVVLLEPGERIAFASTAARQLLQRYFGRNGAALPEPLESWLRDGGSEPLLTSAGDRVLAIELVDEALLLEERRQLPPLTAREREILELVAEGRTNAEIAERLWISRGTVRKHLDNIYAKLGVHTRTAAAAFLHR